MRQGVPVLVFAAGLLAACGSSSSPAPDASGASGTSGTSGASGGGSGGSAGAGGSAGNGPISDGGGEVGPGSGGAYCSPKASSALAFDVEAQGTPDSFDGPADVVEADTTHMLIRPSTGSDAGAAPEVRVTFDGSSPYAVVPPAGSSAWLTLRDANASFTGYLFAALRRSEGGELYFAYHRDNLDLYDAGYFATKNAMGATLSVADTCTYDVPDGCFANQKNTLLALTFSADTTAYVRGGESQEIWIGGKRYVVFARTALRIDGDQSHCTDASTGPFVDFYLAEQGDGVDACRANGNPCDLCCAKYSYPDHTLYPILHDCACAANGPCAAQCEQPGLTDYCSGGGSIDGDCKQCLDAIALSPPAVCATAMAACSQDSPCAAYVGCMKSCNNG